MTNYAPRELDLLSRAFERALTAVSSSGARPAESTKAIVLKGILTAARMGERDEDILVDLGISATRRGSAGTLSRALP